jgi:hypothetical protein
MAQEYDRTVVMEAGRALWKPGGAGPGVGGDFSRLSDGDISVAVLDSDDHISMLVVAENLRVGLTGALEDLWSRIAVVVGSPV